MPHAFLRTLIVGDDRGACRKARELLDSDPTIEIVGIAPTAGACDSIRNTRPHVVLLLSSFGSEEELFLCQEIDRSAPSRVLVLASRTDAETTFLFFKAGAYGCLKQPVTAVQVQRGMHAVAQGCLIVPPSIADETRAILAHRDSTGPEAAKAALSDRETEILRQMSQGRRNHEIAASLGISRKTVETHVRHVLLKLGVRSRTQAVVHAMKSGWL